MMLNLVTNAPEGGTVTIDSVRAGDRLQIVVSDTGIGIAERDLPLCLPHDGAADLDCRRRPGESGRGQNLDASSAHLGPQRHRRRRPAYLWPDRGYLVQDGESGSDDRACAARRMAALLNSWLDRFEMGIIAKIARTGLCRASESMD